MHRLLSYFLYLWLTFASHFPSNLCSIRIPTRPQTQQPIPPHSPNVLFGAQTSATYLINGGSCSQLDLTGPANSGCIYDPLDPSFVTTFVECPPGQIALQNGCVSTGPEAITGVTQQLTDVQTVQCTVNLPIGQPYVVTVTATCVELTITAPSGLALTSKLTPNAFHARIAADKAKVSGL